MRFGWILRLLYPERYALIWGIIYAVLILFLVILLIARFIFRNK